MLTDDGLLVVFFAQRRQEVWGKVIDTFVKTGFQITSAIPISTENENNVIARGKKSIYYSLIITVRKRKSSYEASVTQVRQEIRDAIKSRLQEFVQLDYNRGELLLASVGVALNVATKYSSITSFSKESVAKTALNYAREAAIDELTNREIKEILGESINLDREAELYIWTLRGGSRELDYQEFNQTIISLGINEEELIRKRLVIKQKGSSNVLIANALQRTDSIEEKGEDAIRGQSQVDWFHRFIRKYNQKKSITVFDEISSQSGLPRKFFVAFSKLLVYYGGRYKELSDDEFRIATEAVKNFDDVVGGKGVGLDEWFK